MEYRYPRPNLKEDKNVPIVVIALFDVRDPKDSKIALFCRGESLAYYPGAWSMPAGVIDNLILRREGMCGDAAMLQAQLEIMGELCLFPEDIKDLRRSRRYTRHENGKEWDTSVMIATTERPDKIYSNWEHGDNWKWFSVSDIISDPEKVVPEPRTPNLLDDLKLLVPYMKTLVRQG